HCARLAVRPRVVRHRLKLHSFSRRRRPGIESRVEDLLRRLLRASGVEGHYTPEQPRVPPRGQLLSGRQLHLENFRALVVTGFKAVHQWPALDRYRATRRFHARMRRGESRRHLEFDLDRVARLPALLDDDIAIALNW